MVLKSHHQENYTTYDIDSVTYNRNDLNKIQTFGDIITLNSDLSFGIVQNTVSCALNKMIFKY